MVELTTSEVPARIETSAEAYLSAANVVEAASKASTTAVPASCDPVSCIHTVVYALVTAYCIALKVACPNFRRI